MESPRPLLEMSSKKDFFGRLLIAEYTPRLGQTKFWKTITDARKDLYLGTFPTGYGKSDIGLGSYFIARDDQLRVNRMLIIVPTDTQRSGYVNNLTHSAKSLGCSALLFVDERTGLSGIARLLDGTVSDLRLHLENRCEIFVTTIQAILADPGFYKTLMEKGRWFGFFDEYQKLNMDEKAKWGKAAKDIQDMCVVSIGLTATPIRSDGTPTIFDGLPVDVVVSFKEAYEERAIRGVVAHVEHYYVDVKDENGAVERLTTETLRGATGWDNYRKKRDLRFTSEYLSDFLTRIHDCWEAKNLMHSDQHQILLFAMDQDHAEHTSKMLTLMYGNEFSDWIGVRRKSKENEDVLAKYYDNKLPCLVQVDKATEGFNNKRSSILGFLNILRKNTVKAIQAGGRGVRRNDKIKNFFDDVCDMFASPDTEMADLIQEFANLTIGSLRSPEKRPEEGGEDETSGGDTTLWPIPPFDSCVTGAEYDRSDIYAECRKEADKYADRLRSEEGIVASDDELMAALIRIKTREMEEKLKALKYDVPLTTGKVEKAKNTFASNVARFRGYKNPQFQEKHNSFCRILNRRWLELGGKRAKASLYEDLKAKYEWIEKLNNALRDRGEAPSWLI